MKNRVLSMVLSIVVGVSSMTTPILANTNTSTADLKESAVEESTNLLLKAAVTTSGDENVTFSTAKITDGVINRSAASAEQSRWASTRGLATQDNPKTITITLPQEKTIKSFVIDWERKNVTKFKISYSTDNTTWKEAHSTTSQVANERQVINLQTAIQAKYIKMEITGFVANCPMPDGTATDWDTVSIYEIQGFAKDQQQTTLTFDQVMSRLSVGQVAADATSITMPSVPSGYTISFLGADYEQIVDKDLKIHKPIVDKTVELFFKVSNGTQTKESKAVVVTIPGSQGTNASGNAKPTVVPALAEWVGNIGDFKITDTSKIVIATSAGNKLDDMANIFKADYKEVTGKDITIIKGDIPANGDFYFTLDTKDKGLDEEGYLLTIGDSVKVEAEFEKGAFWSTRTILQILKQTNGSIPKGITRDYPKYEKRGFMLDVGRKFYELDYVYNTMKTMSWYKLNDFQLHLNDNYWPVEDYENQLDGYAGFRLESDIEGLTSKDGAYTKVEFRKLIKDSRKYGVDIIPEFDTPAHSLAFTKVRPDLVPTDTDIPKDHLDITKPETLTFVKAVFEEYLGGTDPVFDQETTIHIGTDEYSNKYAEQFRKYTDDLLKYIRDEKKRTVRCWGSLSAISGNTKVTSENVEMSLWSSYWARPDAMYNQGFDMINTLGSISYIVPNGENDRGGYKDRIQVDQIYKNWVPNKYDNLTLPSGSPQVKGGVFAVWHDHIHKRDPGLTQYDIFDRYQEAFPVYAEKTWSTGERTFDKFKEDVNKVGLAPNSNPRFEVETKGNDVLKYGFEEQEVKDTSGNDYHSVKKANTELVDGKVGKGIKLGKTSYVETPIENMGPNYTVEFWIKKDANATGEQIIMESEIGTIKGNINNTGKLGFSREGVDYIFQYGLKENVWTKVKLVAKNFETGLYINDTFTDVVARTATGGKYATLILPINRIGSKTDGFQGVIDELSITKTTAELTYNTELPNASVTATSDNENAVSGKEGPIRFAFDGDKTTHWHSNYSPKDDLPATVTMTLDKVYAINRLLYLPRQDGKKNGFITKYRLEISKDGQNFTKVSEGSMSDNNILKRIEFPTTEAKVVKFTALEGNTGFASASEIYLQKAIVTQAQPEEPIEIPVTKIVLNKNEVTLEKGGKEKLVVTLEPANATNKGVSFKSLDETIASVSADGTILANGVGTTTIQASIGEVVANCSVKVVQKSPSLEEEKNQLKEIIVEAKAYKEEEYTKDSFAILTKALAHANVVANKEASTLDEIKEARTALEQTIASLKKIEIQVKEGWVLEGSNYRYYKNNKVVTNSWIDDTTQKTWKYVDKDGFMVKGWKEINQKWYLFNKDGIMLTGWQLENGSWYLLAASGEMLTGWQVVGGVWYLLGLSGNMITGWQQVGGVWYLLGPSGNMLTDWQQVGGVWYLLGPSGNMLTGWQQVGATWYLLGTSGNMLNGWQLVNGVWYYLGTDGAMATGNVVIGNKMNKFHLTSGAWLGEA